MTSADGSLPTLLINTEAGPVTINASDYDATKHELVNPEDKPVVVEKTPEELLKESKAKAPNVNLAHPETVFVKTEAGIVMINKCDYDPEKGELVDPADVVIATPPAPPAPDSPQAPSGAAPSDEARGSLAMDVDTGAPPAPKNPWD